MTDLFGDEAHPAHIGLPTYLQLPLARNAGELAGADIAILGAPVDMGVVHRPGARFGPRAISDRLHTSTSPARRSTTSGWT